MSHDTYTATIVAVGYDSCAPDNPGAVDAEIYDLTTCVGEVTLIPGPDGDLDTWGPGLDHWADTALIEHLNGLDDHARHDAIGAIVAAVTTAMEDENADAGVAPAGVDRAAYLALFVDLGQAIEFENQALSISDEFLPPHVRAVLASDGDEEPSPAYWAWLIGQTQSDLEGEDR